MPNGFRYASGPYRTDQAVPSSAFSRGDLIIRDSNSSFSRMATDFAVGADIAGIAMGDSTQSINNLCTILVPEDDTHLWVSLSTELSSHVTPGVAGDILFSVANNRYYFDPSSTNTPRAVCVRGTAGALAVDQSVQSQVIVRLLRVADTTSLRDW